MDDHSSDQDQAGASLFAFGEAISDLLRPDIQHSLFPEIRLVLSKFNDSAKILFSVSPCLEGPKLSLLLIWPKILLMSYRQIFFCLALLSERRLRRLLR